MQIRPAVDNGGMDASRHPVQPLPPGVNRAMDDQPDPVQSRLSLAIRRMAKTHDGSRVLRGHTC